MQLKMVFVVFTNFIKGQPFSAWFSKLPIRDKIGWSYTIALGISFTGTFTGLALGNYYQRSAKEQLDLARTQGFLLTQVQLQSRNFHPEKDFSPVLRNSRRFYTEREEFLQQVVALKTFIEQLENSLPEDSNSPLKGFLAGYKPLMNRYTQEVLRIVDSIEPKMVQPQEVSEIEEELESFANGPTATRFFRYSDEISSLIVQSNQEIQAAELAWENAQMLRNWVILGSSLLSIGIASLLAIFTSRAIADPLGKVNRVANSVTETGDFSLRVPITTQDEVGSLATSLNQLIQWTQEYTNQLKAAQTQLIQGEKMSSLGQMVAGLAHEINNPINFIYGNLQHINLYAQDLLNAIALYQKHYPDPPKEITEYLEEQDLEFLADDLPHLLESLRSGAERIRQLVISLRNFSRLDESEKKVSNLHEGIESTLLLLKNRFQSHIEIIKDYGEIPKIECYPAQLNQVFLNLLNNAIDALQDISPEQKKQIIIKTEIQNHQIRITIKDSGMGIPDAIQSKLFDPFFTTKPVGQGTGIGLAICYQIIEQHHGKIEFNSQVGQGTEFTIFLPLNSIN